VAWGWDQREPAERLVGARARGPGAGAWWLARLGELWVALERPWWRFQKAHGKIRQKRRRPAVTELFLGCSAETCYLDQKESVTRNISRNKPAQTVLCESATWRRSHHEETQPTEQVSVNDAIILSSTPRDRACSSTSRSSSERPGQPHFWWQIVRLHSVTAEGASCAARAFPSEGMQTTRTARCVPADRFPDGVPGTGREPSASLMTNASSATA